MRPRTIIPLLAIAFGLTACYRDYSSEATTLIPDLIVTGLPGSLDVVYGDELTLTVTPYMGTKSPEDFTYQWEVDLSAKKIKDRIEVGDTQTLHYRVTNAPSSSPYLLSVRVTDKETGLQIMSSCYLNVSSSLGEGLLVGYTKPDGTSDVDIIASKELTWGYSAQAPRVSRGIYSLANGSPVPERINCLLQTVDTDGAVYNSHRILMGTPSHVTAIDPLSFETRETDSQLFTSTTMQEYGSTLMFNAAGVVSFMLVGEDCYAHICNIDNVYAKLNNASDTPIRFNTHNMAWASLDQGITAVYNEGDGVYGVRLLSIMGGGFSKLDNSALGFPATGSASLFGGCLSGMRPAFLVKDAVGEYHIVIVRGTNDKDLASSVPLTGENLDQAVAGCFCDNGDLMYYATSRTIYATIISGNTTSVRKLSWQPDSSSERITGIRQYTQAWYGTGQTSPSDYGFVLPTHRAMLIITTHNDATGEGKVYLRGFNVTTGLFTMNGNYGSFGGFGEITAIAPTIR